MKNIVVSGKFRDTSTDGENWEMVIDFTKIKTGAIEINSLLNYLLKEANHHISL